MTTRYYEAVRRGSDILLFKVSPLWRRRRAVEIAAPGTPTRVLDFPLDQDVLLMPSWDPGVAASLTIRHHDFLRRLLGRRDSLTVPPDSGPLRVLITGSGRCGTQSMARWLDGMAFRNGERVVARHETLHEYILEYHIRGETERIREIVRGFLHNLEAGPPYAMMPDQVEAGHVVHLVRDGRRVVQSGVIRGWYQNDRLWNRVKPEFPGSVFERCCLFWRHMVRNAEAMARTTVRLEDLTASAGSRDALLSRLDIVPDGRPFPVANRGRRPSTFDGWTPDQHAVFARICGEEMDRHYPGWREPERETVG